LGSINVRSWVVGSTGRLLTGCFCFPSNQAERLKLSGFATVRFYLAMSDRRHLDTHSVRTGAAGVSEYSVGGGLSYVEQAASKTKNQPTSVLYNTNARRNASHILMCNIAPF